MSVIPVGTWIRAYTRVDAIGPRGAFFDTYEVLYGDSVPKPLVMRRYQCAIDLAVVKDMALEAGVVEAWVAADLFVVVAEPSVIDAFHARVLDLLSQPGACSSGPRSAR
jgi:hypothetical protein